MNQAFSLIIIYENSFSSSISSRKSSEFEQRLNASSDKVNKKLFELRINNSDTFHNPERFL